MASFSFRRQNNQKLKKAKELVKNGPLGLQRAHLACWHCSMKTSSQTLGLFSDRTVSIFYGDRKEELASDVLLSPSCLAAPAEYAWHHGIDHAEKRKIL